MSAINNNNKDLETQSLHDFVRNMEYKSFFRRIIDGGSINSLDDTGFTALHIACQKADFPLIYILLKFGAFVNKESTNGLTPLDCLVSASDCYSIDDSLYLMLIFGAIRSEKSKTTKHNISEQYKIDLNQEKIIKFKLGNDLFRVYSHKKEKLILLMEEIIKSEYSSLTLHYMLIELFVLGRKKEYHVYIIKEFQKILFPNKK